MSSSQHPSVSTRTGRRNGSSRRSLAGGLVAALLAGLAVTIGGGAPAHAVDPNGLSPFVSYNMQGSDNGNRWSHQVADMAARFPVVMIQEAGPSLPVPFNGEVEDIAIRRPSVPRGVQYVQHSRWAPQGSSRGPLHHVYFFQTDPQWIEHTNVMLWEGGRVNLVTITDQPADDVMVVENPRFRADPVTGDPNAYRFRPLLGLRFGNVWYFNVHARGSDVQDLLARARARMGPGQTYVIAGDYNVNIINRTTQEARDLSLHLEPNENLFRTGEWTHVDSDTGSRSELDFAISNVPGLNFVAWSPDTPRSDHRPVYYNTVRTPPAPVRPIHVNPVLIRSDHGEFLDQTANGTFVAYRRQNNENQVFEHLLAEDFWNVLRNRRTKQCVGMAKPLEDRTLNPVLPVDCDDPGARWAIEDPPAEGGPAMWRNVSYPDACLSMPELEGQPMVTEYCDPDKRPQRIWEVAARIPESQWETTVTNQTIQSVTSGSYLDVFRGLSGDDSPVITYPPRDVSNQRWRLETVDQGDNLVRLRPEHATEDCLDVYRSDDDAQPKQAVVYRCDDPGSTNDGEGHRWRVEYIADSQPDDPDLPTEVTFRNEATHLCLEASDRAEAPAVAAVCDDSHSQRWRIGPRSPAPGPGPTTPPDRDPSPRPTRLPPRSNPSTDLRLMPLGDSITYGVGAAGNNGYRRELFDSLQSVTTSLDFVGSMRQGDFADPDHEGHPGWRIDQIDKLATSCSIPSYRPNVVTLHIGTNDMRSSEGAEGAPKRLRALIEDVLDQAPETTVLVATLILSNDPAVNARVQDYNRQIPGIVANLRAQGRYVRTVDMSAVTAADMTDNLHPNAAGFGKMAAAWRAAIVDALHEHWIAPPATVSGTAKACAAETPSPGDGGDDGWHWAGVVASGVGASRDHVRLADLDGDGRDDYLVVDAGGQVSGWLNAPGPNGWGWKYAGVVASGVGATRDQVRFADLNGDHKADYLVVDDAGRVSAWINDYQPGTGSRWIGAGVVATGVGATRDRVRFADLDGDGRDDYLVVDDQGTVTAWLNNRGGTGSAWIGQGQVAAAAGVTRDGLVLKDLDADGRDDYLFIDDAGRIKAWLNDFATRVGGWKYQGEIASGVGVARSGVAMAEINGDGRADYLTIRENGMITAWFNDRFSGVDRWAWQGTVAPGAGVPGAQVRFADLDGDAREDYLVVNETGRIAAWLNAGRDGDQNWGWVYQGIAAPGVGSTGDRVRLADINGDGRVDYLVVDDSSRVRAWLNGGKDGNGRWVWNSVGEIAAGVGVAGSQVRFADVDGDRKADYLVVDAAGRVRAWHNNRGGSGAPWGDLGLIATGVGVTDAEVRFADVNGDRRADYLAVDDAGRVRAWLNDPAGGWTLAGEIATGIGASGDQVRLADVNGDRRADYLIVGADSAVRAWLRR
ncbi:hypothetical protein TPA0907_30710 [Micromonospora humidisoli]|uniref:FG-GAP-like repeat-containing protein n=1 Tax=Micromonospora sp. AKA109 TaxID=2733865 RepID=UPI0022C28393|nr:FG-GAP-like repeat-containing protein [Micromonospora sp. AKA109]GHJ08704.1 hypothetical protein TPA0907_30710 [Micromonospora sp. AKA109]